MSSEFQNASASQAPTETEDGMSFAEMLAQQEQDEGFRAYALNPNAQPHMDTPLTLDNEYRLLSDAGFHSIEIHSLKDPRYRLMTAVKPC